MTRPRLFTVNCLERAIDPWRVGDFAGREGFKPLSFIENLEMENL
jgi:hypothetical protein